MAKTSKKVADRMTVSRTVHSSVATHGSDIAEALGQALFPAGVPAKLTMDKLLTAIGAVLTRADQAMTTSDLAHVVELSDDDQYRLARDEATAAVRARLISLRELLSGLYGATVLGAYALDEAVPDAADQVLGRAAATVKLLRTRPLNEKPRHSSVTIDPKQLAADLASDQAALQAALDATKREEREAQLTLEDKNRAGQSWQDAYQAVSSTFYGLYLLAGRKDLADRITPTARRRAGLPDPGDTPESAPPKDPSSTPPK